MVEEEGNTREEGNVRVEGRKRKKKEKLGDIRKKRQ